MMVAYHLNVWPFKTATFRREVRAVGVKVYALWIQVNTKTGKDEPVKQYAFGTFLVNYFNNSNSYFLLIMALKYKLFIL